MMSKQIEALKMAIEALERAEQMSVSEYSRQGDYDEAIQACKEALEQPAQEPVAWGKNEANCYGDGNVYRGLRSNETSVKTYHVNTHPAPSWQGLSDDEMMKTIEICEDKCGRHLIGGIMIARAIEQALEEKNT